MSEFQAALAGVPSDQPEREAEAHVELAWAAAHAYDTPVARRHATAALALATGRGRPDLTTHATGVLGLSDSADGDLDGAMRRLEDATERARALALHLPPRAPTWHSLMLYWTGRLEEAAERGGEAVQAARSLNDVSGTMLALMVAGISLAGSGRYAEAVQSFAEAGRLGREHGAESLAARNAAFAIGLHLDVYDYPGVEALAAEAREFGRSSNHGPSVFNSTIDLLFAFARTQRAGEAEALVPGVLAGIAATGGWHHWLWSIRLSGARAELALARGDWDSALRFAGQTVEEAGARRRVKYEALGLAARGRALAARGRTRAALAPLRRAVALVRPVGDPAMFLRAATALLEVDGDDALAGEARAAAGRILDALPDAALRSAFAAAEPVPAAAPDRRHVSVHRPHRPPLRVPPGAAGARRNVHPGGLLPHPRPPGRRLQSVTAPVVGAYRARRTSPHIGASVGREACGTLTSRRGRDRGPARGPARAAYGRADRRPAPNGHAGEDDRPRRRRVSARWPAPRALRAPHSDPYGRLTEARRPPLRTGRRPRRGENRLPTRAGRVGRVPRLRVAQLAPALWVQSDTHRAPSAGTRRHARRSGPSAAGGGADDPRPGHFRVGGRRG